MIIRAVLSISLWLAFVSSTQATAPQQKPVLTWCLDHFPHFHHYADTSTPTGPSVDLMQQLADRAGFILNYTARTPGARCLRMMETGEVDLMSNLKFSPERAEFMYLLPYYNTVPESLFVLNDMARPATTIAQLQQLRLISIRNYLYTPDIKTLLDNTPLHALQVETVEAGLEMLLRQRVDGLLAPTISTLDVIDHNSSYQQRFKIMPLNTIHFSPGYIHIGLSKHSSHAGMAQSLQQALQSLIADGTVDRLYQQALRQDGQTLHKTELE
ncbi:transporter substrate-binding domain-containing protein [Chromatiaceae bacterium AAb-1]|nr:transporter substrate-binding domain-containing protein [Chromatiaceae bacterium AAb-1]